MIDFDNKRLIEGVRKMKRVVAASYGSRGEFVAISHPAIPNNLRVTKDGINILTSVHSEDPVEEIAMKILRQASKRTAIEAGDGSTATCLIAASLLDKALELSEGINKNVLIRELKEKAELVDKMIQKKSKKVSHSKIKKVAHISSNNNSRISKLVSDLYKTSDRVIFEKSNDGKLTTSSIDGIKVDRGYSSKFFVNNHKANECVLENPLILITDTKIDNLQMIEGLLRYVVSENRSLFIIGELSHEVLSTFNLNVSQNKIKFAHIMPPSLGHQRELLMADIAAMTYGTYYSDMAGAGVANASIEGLGTADKVIVGQSKTIIVPKKLNKEYIDDLKASKNKTDFTEERIDKISGKLNTVFIGAPTEAEQNELYDQIEDVVLACKSAIEQGVVVGGGVTYKDIATKFTDDSISSQIIRYALLEPIRIISGIEEASEWADNIGYDSIKLEVCNLEKAGILDPAKVAREAFSNAISVACILLNTNTVVVYGGSQ